MILDTGTSTDAIAVWMPPENCQKSEKQKVEIMSLSSLERSILSSQTELPPGS